MAFASPFGAARLSEPRAADFFVYVILRALGPLLADVQIPPRVRGDWYTQREYSLRSWRSRPRFGAARLSEPRAAGLYRIWSFAGARSASRGCTVHPARILAALVAFASPERGRSAERTSRRGLFRICHFTGARSASRGCTDPPAGAGGLVHPARILAALVAFASPFRGRSAKRTLAHSFLVIAAISALGPLLADVQIPPRMRGDWYTQRESNSHLRLRRPAVYPLSYGCG